MADLKIPRQTNAGCVKELVSNINKYIFHILNNICRVHNNRFPSDNIPYCRLGIYFSSVCFQIPRKYLLSTGNDSTACILT